MFNCRTVNTHTYKFIVSALRPRKARVDQQRYLDKKTGYAYFKPQVVLNNEQTEAGMPLQYVSKLRG